jgi:hypothetical protein
MADYPGIILDPNLRAAPLSYVPFIGAPVAGISISATSNAKGGSSAGTFTGAMLPAVNFAGQMQKMFGFNLFERIIVIPRVKAIGFVLSSTQFPVEVWNTFHDANEDLQSISTTGPGGVTISNPFTLPKTIGPQGSIIFQAIVPAAGDVNILEDIVFVFSGITGTDMAVTGSRILVFSVAPDWAEGIEERIEYLTNVLTAYDDSEQRRSLRAYARRGLRFRAKALDPRTAAGMEALIWGWQHQPYGVPFWADQQQLAADVSAGSFVLQVNTVDRLFAAGGLLMIWQDVFTFEALTILSLTSTTVTLSAPTQFAWKAGAGSLIVPLFLGRCANGLELSRLWSGGDELEIEFAGEALQVAPTLSIALTQFKGFDVLEIPPNWANGLKRNYRRSTVTMDPGIGPITVDDKGGTAIVSHDLPWWIDTHAKITLFRAFVLARLGKFAPFWQPTWDQDLVLAGTAFSGTSVINIKSMNYTRFFFLNPARRFLALIPQGGGGANRYVQVIASIDNFNGTESLTLAAPLSGDVNDQTMISFLTFSRLSEDVAAILWQSTEYAEAVLAIQELPREVPA